MTRALFLGNESSASPLAPVLRDLADVLRERGFDRAALSARFGPRMVTNATTALAGIGPDDFVEVADYDSHNDHVLVIGDREPGSHAALHALVFRAKKEVGAIVQMDAAQAAGRDLPDVVPARRVVDSAMGILEALRATDAVRFGTGSVFAVGATPRDAVIAALTAIGENAADVKTRNPDGPGE